MADQRIHVIEAETPLDLYRTIINVFLHDGMGYFTPYATDSKNMTRLWAHNLVFRVKRAYPNDFDLALTGYTMPQRWGKFLREYTEPKGFQDFLAKAVASTPWQQSGYSTPVIAKHNLGNCLVGITAHRQGSGQRPEVTLHSRATMLTPTGGLDIGFGAAIAEALVGMGYDEDVSLVWHVSMGQAVSWKMILTMALMGMLDDPDDLPDTMMGRKLHEHIDDAMNDRLPKLKMFFRVGNKYRKWRETGVIGRTASSFFPHIPLSHLPVIRRSEKYLAAYARDDEFVDPQFCEEDLD